MAFPVKQIAYEKEAREKLASGADKLARAVISTLGPLSRNVAIDREYPAPNVIHDGVTVAKAIYLKDRFENMGAALLREAASKTNDLAGDGTTTATLLANTLIQEGIKLTQSGVVDNVITSSKTNPMRLRNELFLLSQEIVKRLDKMKKKIKLKSKDIEHIATISAASEELGKLIAEAFEKVGKDGVVITETTPAFENSLEIQDGIQFSNGYLSPAFITNPHRQIAEYDDAFVLLTDMTITNPDDLVPLIEAIQSENQRPLLIVANDVINPALTALALTKLQRGLKVVAVIAPEYAERRKEMLDDLAILTGGNVIAQETGGNLKETKLSDLGRARHVKVSQTHTTIIPENPDPEEIKERVESIKLQIKESEEGFSKDKLKERLGGLTNGIATIKIGGASQTEVNDKKERATDAVNATKAALSEGIIVGGGLALRKIAREFEGIEGISVSEEAENLIITMLKKPFEQIIVNSGKEVEKIEEQINWDSETHGYDVLTDEFVDMFEKGIVDPVKVTKLAVQHAISVAAMILTTDVLITDEPEEKKNENE